MSGKESLEGGRTVNVYEGSGRVVDYQKADPQSLLAALAEALKEAADATDADESRREGGWYKLELFGHVTRNSPGWFDGFAIRASTPPG